MGKGELSGRIAVVTGAGRRREIGTAICRALADKGADILFVWHPHDRRMRDEGGDPAELEEELRSKGVRAEGFAMDLSSPAAPEKVLNRVEERLGSPSILVNNAAYSTLDGVDGLDADTLDAHYAVNVRAAVLLSVGFVRRWKGERGGRIINLTSGQSLGPMPGEIAYVTSKGAIEAFTSTFAVEVASRGVTVNAVNPGPTDTGWMTEELKRELLARFPTGRLGQPEDAARLIAFLAGDESEWITGQVIHSEGGFWRR
ncbi:SDR family oxidoreductase [Planifilum fimeticola]